MASQKELKNRLKVLMNRPENQVCSDCKERQPRWASLIVPPPGAPPGTDKIGAFCCLECSGSHRRLGVHISFVRSITLDSWKEQEVVAMERGGNRKVNLIFEARLSNPDAVKPHVHADGPTRERFIRDKYERRKYYDPAAFSHIEEESSSEEEESSSEEEEEPVNVRRGRKHQNNAFSTGVRPPSEAARRRVEARKAGSARSKALLRAPSDPYPAKSSRTPPARTLSDREPEIDLLDLGGATPAPAPATAPVNFAMSSPNFGYFPDQEAPPQPQKQRSKRLSKDPRKNRKDQVGSTEEKARSRRSRSPTARTSKSPSPRVSAKSPLRTHPSNTRTAVSSASADTAEAASRGRQTANEQIMALFNQPTQASRFLGAGGPDLTQMVNQMSINPASTRQLMQQYGLNNANPQLSQQQMMQQQQMQIQQQMMQQQQQLLRQQQQMMNPAMMQQQQQQQQPMMMNPQMRQPMMQGFGMPQTMQQQVDRSGFPTATMAANGNNGSEKEDPFAQFGTWKA